MKKTAVSRETEIRKTACGGKKQKGTRSRFLCATMSIMLTFLLPCSALADENITSDVGTGYSAEDWAKLTDNVLEYDEIPDLVHNFNSTIVNVWETLQDTQEQLQKSITELESQRRKVKELKETAEDEGDVSALIVHTTNEYIFDAVISGLRPTANSLLMQTTTRSSIVKAENQITQAVQSLMIAYDSAVKQRDTLNKLSEMYEAQYQLTLREQTLGMATETDVLTAKTNLLSAQSSSAALESGLSQILPSLCSLTGWAADATPEIVPIPETDLTRIDEMDLEADTVKAIGNNTTLISQRTSEKGNSTATVSARLGVINEGDEKLTIVMKQLYNDVLAKETALESAKAGWESAQLSRDSYERMYQLGMLSEADYLGTQVSYYQEKAAYEAADTALLLALETYHWAVKGLVDIE